MNAKTETGLTLHSSNNNVCSNDSEKNIGNDNSRFTTNEKNNSFNQFLDDDSLTEISNMYNNDTLNDLVVTNNSITTHQYSDTNSTLINTETQHLHEHSKKSNKLVEYSSPLLHHPKQIKSVKSSKLYD